jgi:hypothetical protein
MTARRTPHNTADGREVSRQHAMIAIAAALLGATFMVPAPTMAQMPPDIVEKVAALGRVVDPENTAKIYAPLLMARIPARSLTSLPPTAAPPPVRC